MKYFNFIICLCTLFLISTEAKGVQKLITFSQNLPYDSIIQYKEAQTNDDSIIFSQEIIVDTSAFFSADIVALQLDHEEIIVSKKRSFINKEMEYCYNAYESENASAYISKMKDDIYGMIYSASGTYSIETYNNKYVLEKINEDEIPEDSEPIILNEILDSVGSSIDNRRSANALIRVLVMYTSDALALSPNMLNKVFFDINNGNSSFVNSNVNAQFELAYIGPTASSEGSLSFNLLLDKFRTNGDGMFDEVHALRNKYAADVCVLLVSATQYCGLGYLHSNSNNAFAVVYTGTGCACKYTFTHEIGHNIGCGHDLDAPSHDSPYQYGHGMTYYVEGNSNISWRTMMAYGTACNDNENYCKRILYWSNPNVYYNGVPMGDSSLRNNARVWNERAGTVSSFRNKSNTLSYTSANNNTQAIFESIEATTQITTGGGFEVQSGQTVEMKSQTIRLTANTHIKNGATFRATSNTSTNSNPYPQFQNGRDVDDTRNELANNPSYAAPRKSLSGSIELKPEINISPNPTKDLLTVSANVPITEVLIYNLDGQCVLQTTAIEINVSNLPSGIYILHANTEGGGVLQGKFVHL